MSDEAARGRPVRAESKEGDRPDEPSHRKHEKCHWNDLIEMPGNLVRGAWGGRGTPDFNRRLPRLVNVVFECLHGLDKISRIEFQDGEISPQHAVEVYDVRDVA